MGISTSSLEAAPAPPSHALNTHRANHDPTNMTAVSSAGSTTTSIPIPNNLAFAGFQFSAQSICLTLTNSRSHPPTTAEPLAIDQRASIAQFPSRQCKPSPATRLLALTPSA